MKDLLAYLFGDSQVENEVEETKSAIERIMEEAEKQEPLKVERKPLQSALKSLGISGELEYDPEGFSLVCGEEADYRRYTEILLSPDAMEKLAKQGWVVTRCGDVAMSNEPAEFRIRFLEITTAGEDSEDKNSWPAPNQKLVKNAVKKGREFMSEPGPHDDDSPVEYDDKTSDDNQKGVGKAQAGKDPEGKPKGSGKSEALELAESVLVNEGRHKDGCQCGFCKNMGSFGKKKKDTEAEAPETGEMEENEKPHQVEVPYVGKDGKQRQVPFIRVPKPKPAKKQESHVPVTLKRPFWGHKTGTKGKLRPGHSPSPVNKYTGKLKLRGSPLASVRDTDKDDLYTVDSETEPPRYDDMFEAMAKKKAPGVGKPKAPKTVPKSFKK